MHIYAKPVVLLTERLADEEPKPEELSEYKYALWSVERVSEETDLDLVVLAAKWTAN